ncbi:MAG: hypothetical protein M1519_00935 [Actinobacteria bacterium]|nr:hypothetical protein [Actinomycetota bacterium]
MEVVHGNGDVGEDSKDASEVPNMGIYGHCLDPLAPGRGSLGKPGGNLVCGSSSHDIEELSGGDVEENSGIEAVVVLAGRGHLVAVDA